MPPPRRCQWLCQQPSSHSPRATGAGFWVRGHRARHRAIFCPGARGTCAHVQNLSEPLMRTALRRRVALQCCWDRWAWAPGRPSVPPDSAVGLGKPARRSRPGPPGRQRCWRACRPASGRGGPGPEPQRFPHTQNMGCSPVPMNQVPSLSRNQRHRCFSFSLGTSLAQDTSVSHGTPCGNGCHSLQPDSVHALRMVYETHTQLG